MDPPLQVHPKGLITRQGVEEAPHGLTAIAKRGTVRCGGSFG